jgi:hypothetical protein
MYKDMAWMPLVEPQGWFRRSQKTAPNQQPACSDAYHLRRVFTNFRYTVTQGNILKYRSEINNKLP